MPTAPPSTNTPTISVAAASAVLRVGDGRGFVVECRNHLGYDERIVVTAAHCLVDVFLANGTQGLPSCHPARYTEDGTYKALLGPLGAEPTVWATCLFVDPIAGIAVLGQPDNQVLIDGAAAFDALMDSVRALAIADAPAQGSELVTGFGGRQFEKSHAREGLAWVLSLRRALARGPCGTSWRLSVVLRQIARRLDGRSDFAPHRANKIGVGAGATCLCRRCEQPD